MKRKFEAAGDSARGPPEKKQCTVPAAGQQPPQQQTSRLTSWHLKTPMNLAPPDASELKNMRRGPPPPPGAEGGGERKSWGMGKQRAHAGVRVGSASKPPPPKSKTPARVRIIPAKEYNRKREIERRLAFLDDNGYTQHAAVVRRDLPKLNPEQLRVLDLALMGHNVFITGGPGTGKTLLLNVILALLNPGRTGKTASTGIAGVQIGGMTTHSFAGFQLGQGTMDQVIGRVMRNPNAKLRWWNTATLVIDEISMLDNDLFDKLDGCARATRDIHEPMGGMQVIVVGDFLQLPPVDDPDAKRVTDQGSTTGQFAFFAKSWTQLKFKNCMLTRVMRQADARLANALAEIRYGECSDATAKLFAACRADSKQLLEQRRNRMQAMTAASGGADAAASGEPAIEPTRLYATRRDVSQENLTRLAELEGEAFAYTADDSGVEPYLGQIRKHCQAPESLTLKVGAQVMCVKNLSFEDQIVNGSRGVVIGFASSQDDPAASPQVTAAGGDTAAAVEDHDEPGMPRQERKVQARNDADDEAVVVDGEGEGGAPPPPPQPASWALVAEHDMWPLVRFNNGVVRMMKPEGWEVEVQGEILAKRVQVPLMLAWSLTIHKSQGQTLDAAEVSMKSIRSPGQVAVALSRVRTLESLSLLDWDPHAITASAAALHFYKTLKCEDLSTPTQETSGAGAGAGMGSDDGRGCDK